MSYLGRSAKLSLKAQEKVSFLATAGQTVKTGLSYTPSFIEVYVNGVLLTDTTDFTATNGNSITFTVALLLNDEVTVISLKTFTVADHYSKTEADTLLAAKSPLASPSFTGSVGIGTASPSRTLEVYSSQPAIKLNNGTNAFTIGTGAFIDGSNSLVFHDEGVGERMRIDGTGNVGIGQQQGTSSTANQRLLINADAQGGIGHGLYIHNDSYSAGRARIAFGPRYSFSYNTSPYIESLSESTSAAALIFGTTTGTTAREAMRIDAAGRVTQPLQPVVFVTRQSTLSVGNDSANSPTTLNFDSAILNIGSHFNLSNDRFTAPVAGRYEISWSYPSNPDSATVYRTFIWKNGTKLAYTQLRVDSNGHTGYLMGSRTAILELASSDYFVIGASSDNSTNFYADGELRIVMTIRLIG